MTDTDYVLDVQDLKTYFYTFRGVVKAVDGVSFKLKRGGILGVVGESGCGKSVTGFSLMKMVDPPGKFVGGKILFNGENILEKNEKEMEKIRGNQISMIFQDPMTSLNPVYTIGEQLLESLELHQKNLSKQERWDKAVSLLKLVGIPSPEERMKEYPHQFSGGMRQRVIIAIALATNPALIIADEPTTALDVTVQSQIVWELKELVHREHSSLIMITHDIALISQIAENIIVMYCGKVIESGTMEDIIFHAKHPYTQGLLHSIPTMTDSEDRLEPIKGIVPSMFDLPKGCKFAPRCGHCKGICLEKEPEKISIDGHHTVCCHLYTEGRS